MDFTPDVCSCKYTQFMHMSGILDPYVICLVSTTSVSQLNVPDQKLCSGSSIAFYSNLARSVRFLVTCLVALDFDYFVLV